MKGNVKIELFDAVTGEKTKEQNDSNFISKGAKKVMEMQALKLFTAKKIKDNLYTDPFSFPFEKIVLTNADHAENPNEEWLLMGDVIGVAAIGYGVNIPQNALTGILNKEETIINDKKARFVIDFPTDKGNGTFQSIYTQTNSYFLSSGMNLETVKADAGYRKVIFYKGKLHFLYNGKIRVYDLNWIKTKEIIINSSVKDFTIYEDFYYLLRDNRIDTVTKIDFLDTTQEVKVLDLDSSSAGGIEYLRKENEFLIADYASGARKMHYFDVDFQKIRESELGGSSTYSNGVIVYDDSGAIFTTYTNQTIIDGKIADISTPKIYGFTENGFIANDVIAPKVNIGSRSLLSEPITKNNTQTMKITYEFTLPSIHD